MAPPEKYGFISTGKGGVGDRGNKLAIATWLQKRGLAARPKKGGGRAGTRKSLKVSLLITSLNL